MKSFNIVFSTLFCAAFGCEFLSKNESIISVDAPSNKTFCFDIDVIDEKRSQSPLVAFMIKDKLFQFQESEYDSQSKNLTYSHRHFCFDKLILCTKWPNFTMPFYYVKVPKSKNELTHVHVGQKRPFTQKIRSLAQKRAILVF